MPNSASKTPAPSPDVLRDAEAVVRQLLLVFKNYGFYPEDHTTCRNVLAAFQKALASFLETRGPLSLDIGKGRIELGGETLHESTGQPGEMDQVLFRDGIRSIEFQPGIDPEGVSRFCGLLNRYRVLDSEAEGDLVTGLWSADIPHLSYDATIYWEAPPLESFPPLKPYEGAMNAGELARSAHEIAGNADVTGRETIPDSVTELTEEEMERLREMVEAEENWEAMSDVFDIFLIILDHQDNAAGFEAVLTHLAEEFRDALAAREFDLSRKLLLEMEKIRRAPGPDRAWVAERLDAFFDRISGPESLKVLRAGEPSLDRLTKAQFQDLFKTIGLLRPIAAVPLAEMLAEVESRPARRVLMKAVTRLIQRDVRAVDPLLSHPDETLVSTIVELIAGLPEEESEKRLATLLSHESPAIRRQVLEQYLERHPNRVQEIFSRIDDASEPIRRRVLTHLARERNPDAERLLREHLEGGAADSADRSHRTACFRALGQCGSAWSVPFLKEILAGQPWSDIFSMDPAGRRADAALALSLLDTESAREVLRKARKSRFPHIRRACAAVWKDAP
ncbi:MAG: HEAT repeat domain-containing protein [Desulfococcaceae bacterium]